VIGPLVAINYAPAAGIRGLWAGPFLEDVYVASPEVIGNVTLLMAICMIVGSLAYGPLDTLFNTRKWVVFFGNLVTLAVLVVLSVFAVLPLWQAALALAAIGLFGSGYGMIMAHARAFYPPHLIGRGVTLMNFFSIGGVGVMQFSTGMVAEATYSRLEPYWAFSMVFVTYAVPLAVALVIYLRSVDRPPHETAVKPAVTSRDRPSS
jgi:nitrate/nitrite transporter NarK